ncbi:retrovirus-related pol polyprotein from transposon TNT 1-94, partial [Tanacetum coccineum]
MLNSAKLPKQFWGEAVNMACYTQNRSIIRKRHGKTAYDVFRGRSPDISYFHVFGCPVHIHNHIDHLGKFDEKVNDGFFLGYSPVAKAFRQYLNPEGDAINFNEYRFFPDDEFLKPRNKRPFSVTWPISYMAMHELCKNVVDRSQGQLVDITIIGFCDDELLEYVAD